MLLGQFGKEKLERQELFRVRRHSPRIGSGNTIRIKGNSPSGTCQESSRRCQNRLLIVSGFINIYDPGKFIS
jgi:hypothetical protein